MNKLFTKIASLTLGLALVASAGALIGKGVEAKSVSAGTTTDIYNMSDAIGNSYGKHENDDFIVTCGGGDTSIGVNGTAANKSKLNLASYPRYAVSPATTDEYAIAVVMKKSVSDVTTLSFAYTAGTNCNKGAIYAIYSSNDVTYSLLTITDGTAQGTQLTTTSGSASFIFSSCSGYFGIVIRATETIGNTSQFKYTNCTMSLTYESSTPVGTLTIDDLSSTVLTTGNSGSLGYTFVPEAGDSAEITSHTWTSSKPAVFSVTGDSFNAVAPGSFSLNLQAQDSNGQSYNINSKTYYVSNALSFEIGDDVALVSKTTETVSETYELTGIDKTGTKHFGTIAEFTGDPAGTYRLTVGSGELPQTYSFLNESNYLSWSSDNTLSSSTTLNENSSWYVIAYNDYVSILNAQDTTRDILLNIGSTRFACYQNNTSYPRSDLIKLPEPLNPRGSIAITSPSSSLMKKGDEGALSYSWTPNVEAPDAYIVSFVWDTTDSSVISVDNGLSTYEATGAGTAKLSYVATDSLGEEYTGSTSLITVKNCVSGDYVKVTSVDVGDTVAIVCEAENTELSGIVKISSNYVGDYAFYSISPDSVYDLTIEEGNQEGSFALATPDSKYLSWTSGNTLTTSDEINDNSSWNITFDDGNAVIKNLVKDSDKDKVLMYNQGNPRFACYTNGGQTAVQLYAPVTSYSEAVVEFATDFLSQMTCDGGETLPDSTTWLGFETTFNSAALTDTDRTDLQNAKAIDHEIPSTDVERVQAAMARYDLIVVKYNKGQGMTTEYPDFIERNPSALKVITDNGGSISNSTTSIVVVTIISLVSISSIAVLLVIKKRKHN